MATRRRSGPVAALLGAMTMVLAASGAQADGSGKWTSGKEIYEKVCGYCHEPRTGLGPNIKGLHPLYVRDRVRHGFRAMPPFRQSEIDDQSLAKLTEYLAQEAQ